MVPRRSGNIPVLSCTVCRFVNVILPAAAHSSRSSLSILLNFRLEIFIDVIASNSSSSSMSSGNLVKCLKIIAKNVEMTSHFFS